MYRVLAHLHRLHAGGTDHSLYLLKKLRPRFQLVVSTVDPFIVEKCQELGIECVLYQDQPVELPKWLRVWHGKPLLGALHQAIHEYKINRWWGQIARRILDEVQPDALLLSGDERGILYHLCRQAKQPVIVPQVTIFTFLDAPSMIQHYEYYHRGVKTLLKPIFVLLLRLLSLLLGRSLLYDVGGYKLLPHGFDIGTTIGSALAGVEHRVPLKGTFADVLCINGELYQAFFQMMGINAQIQITGSPMEDQYVEFLQAFTPEKQRAFKAEYDLPDDKILITFLSQGGSNLVVDGQDAYLGEITWIIETLVGLSEDVFVVVKTHPRDRARSYDHLVRMPRVKIIGTPKTNNDLLINSLVVCSCFAVTRNSTTGNDVVGLDTPLLTYNFSDLTKNNFYEAVGCSLHAKDRQTFARYARELAFDVDRRQELLLTQARTRTRIMQVDGRSCERIGDAIFQACRSREAED
jgi:hypothetical protein